MRLRIHSWCKRTPLGCVSLWAAAWLALLSAPGSTSELQPFQAEDFRTIEQRYEGRPFVVALWSLTCPPCLPELDMLGEWHSENPSVPLVLISTDSLGQAPAAKAKLAEAGLTAADSWIFADDFVEKLRYAIDPKWRGELPRTYFYSGNQSEGRNDRQGISGALSRELLELWQMRLVKE